MSGDIECEVVPAGAFGQSCSREIPAHGQECSMEEAGLLPPGTPGAILEPKGRHEGSIKTVRQPQARCDFTGS